MTEKPKNSENVIPREIDMLLATKDYLKLVEDGKRLRDRVALEDSATDELIEAVAMDINSGLETGTRKALFHLRNGEMREIFLQDDSKRRVKIRTTAFYKNKGYDIKFLQSDDYSYAISVYDGYNERNDSNNNNSTEPKQIVKSKYHVNF